MPYSAALFDLDGTLQDSEILWIRATQDFLNDNGVPYDLAATTALVYGRSSLDIYNDIAAMPQMAGRTVADLMVAIRLYFGRLAAADISYPSSVDLLKRMALDMPVAIVSGSPKDDVVAAARDLGVAPSVSLILGAEDVARGKPDPEGFLKAAAALGAAPERCIVFEDSSAGIAAAKAAGMTCVAIARDGRPRQDTSLADITVTDLSEFQYP
ncbi:MAG: HAD family phosphatase [Kiritimatiellae bacterium]|nr:HAD family phosphatase [Kiritimatiellia bacterium]